MASSPNNELLPTEALSLSCTQSNCCDSSGQPSQLDPDQFRPSSSPSTDATTAVATDGDHPSGKRKRDEQPTEPESTKDPSLNPLYKTSLCSYFRRHSGSCSHGSACRYAHGEEELRPRPDNTWDPTSERAKKAMKLENDGSGQCQGKVAEEIMMTDVVANDGDGDNDGGGGCLDPGLSKCLVHLPRKWSSDNLKKFLNDQGVLFKHAKKKKGMAVGFVSFESVEQLKSAVEKLEGRSVGNDKIKVVDVIPRAYDEKIKSAMAFPQQTQVSKSALDGENVVISKSSGGLGDDANDDESVQDSSVSRGKCVRDVVTPLAHMPYEEQLEHKKSSVMQMLKKLTRSARKACPNGVPLPEWILKSREIGGIFLLNFHNSLLC
uniref:Uncharacterized protein MANES_04G021900 n=1 Tax=Rhizophora mucronata TaxID=61149 RepID=A0A2P2L509_RHIMU